VDEGSHLRRGKVKNCGTGVQVAGTGTHKVSTIHATENSNGFIVESDDNLLLLNKANNNDLAGFDVRSESNRFLINKANNNAAGFFLLNAPSNDIFWNVASHNDLYGIAIEAGTEFGEDNTVQRNRAFGNGTFDLFDRRIGCGTNIWDHNKFGTANQACIE
jgi:hypothetical protein